LQNIPIRTELGRKIRNAFVAPSGFKILSLDYSQIELRLAAHMSGDKKMIEAFKNNIDIHSATASEINRVSLDEVTKNMRREAKAINFGILYGQGPFGLSRTALIPYARAKEFIDKYFEVYSGIKSFINKQIKKGEEKGYVETLFGRRRYIPEIKSQVPMVKKGAERIAINTPLQGSNADMIKEAMIKIDDLIEKKYKDKIKMIIQVHDELLFEVDSKLTKEASDDFAKIMKEIIKLKVPVLVDAELGDNWGELKKIKTY
jgi:DNA polymerase-1